MASLVRDQRLGHDDEMALPPTQGSSMRVRSRLFVALLVSLATKSMGGQLMKRGGSS